MHPLYDASLGRRIACTMLPMDDASRTMCPDGMIPTLATDGAQIGSGSVTVT
jgi:hypothetical protein